MPQNWLCETLRLLPHLLFPDVSLMGHHVSLYNYRHHHVLGNAASISINFPVRWDAEG